MFIYQFFFYVSFWPIAVSNNLVFWSYMLLAEYFLYAEGKRIANAMKTIGGE